MVAGPGGGAAGIVYLVACGVVFCRILAKKSVDVAGSVVVIGAVVVIDAGI
jgi:hypothetical protein